MLIFPKMLLWYNIQLHVKCGLYEWGPCLTAHLSHAECVSLLSLQETGLGAEDSADSLNEFQMVLSELVGEESMDSIRVEYEKLIQALKKSQDNEMRLMSKCRELTAEIVSSSSKVVAAIKLSKEDGSTITLLKRVSCNV